MSEKRKDKKGRNLFDGEHQKKGGRYEYKYYDVDGSRRTITSWTLVSTDKMPDGKRQKKSIVFERTEKTDIKRFSRWY